MKKFRTVTVLAASTAFAFGALPAIAATVADGAADVSNELPIDADGGSVSYEDDGDIAGGGVADEGVSDGDVGEPGFEEGNPGEDFEITDPGEEIVVKDGDPMPYERDMDGIGGPEMMYTMGGGAEDFGGSFADDAAEAAADNAADKALARAEASASSRVLSGAE